MQVSKIALASAILLGNSLIASADPTTPQEIGQAMCQRFTTAFNAKDLDAQMALYTDDATQVSPEQGMIVGSEARKKSFTDVYKITSITIVTVPTRRRSARMQPGLPGPGT